MARRGMSRAVRLWLGTAVVVASVAALSCGGAGQDDDGPDEASRAAAEAARRDTERNAVREAVWSADGRRLAVTWTRGRRTHLLGLFGPHDDVPPAESAGLPLAEGEAGWATWAPDGLWVAYTASQGGNREVIRARPDGMGPENLTADPADDFDPAYSPDGRTIAFVSTRSEDTPKLFVMDADGDRPRLLAELAGPVRRPMWAPNGARLAVEVTVAGEKTVAVVAADGSGAESLGPGALPAWSADGARVVCTLGDSLLWRPAGGGAPTLAVPNARAGRPSPDGRWMAFVRGDSLTAALYLADLQTGEETRITSR